MTLRDSTVYYIFVEMGWGLLISVLVPLGYCVTITRGLFAKGMGLRELAPQLVSLVGMSVVFFAASAWVLGRRMV